MGKILFPTLVSLLSFISFSAIAQCGGGSVTHNLGLRDGLTSAEEQKAMTANAQCKAMGNAAACAELATYQINSSPKRVNVKAKHAGNR